MSVIVNNVTRLYGSQKALDGVSFEAKKGQVIGFLGPNGAGKSTMMKIITCYLPQTSGTVTVGGYDVVEQSIDVRRITGYLPEHNPLYTDMYVKEYLGFIASVHGIKRGKTERVDEMVAVTGLTPEQGKKIGALSKGYRQRVGLAQALIHDPEVLILDEPTSGLDPNQLAEIRALIREIGKEKTVILSTHIMQEVEAVCDQVIIINKGKITADASTNVLRQKTAGEQVFIVEFDREVSASLLSVIPGVIGAAPGTGNMWRITANADIRAEIFNRAVAGGITVLSLTKEESSLEDIFHRLTKNS